MVLGRAVTQRVLEWQFVGGLGVGCDAEGARMAICWWFWGAACRRHSRRGLAVLWLAREVLGAWLALRPLTSFRPLAFALLPLSLVTRTVSAAEGASEAATARFARDPAQPLLHENAWRKGMRASRGIQHSRCYMCPGSGCAVL